MIVDCGERMLRMLQIAQRRLQVLSDPHARLLTHTAAALVKLIEARPATKGAANGARWPRDP